MLIFPVFIPHLGCPQSCIYCDQYQISGVIDPDWESLLIKVKEFCLLHHDKEKEIAFFGGSFTCLPSVTQLEIYDRFSTFLDESTHLRYSTRPDSISQQILIESYARGVRTVELGIQDFNDHVLQLSRRGYDRQQALSACHLVKSSGMKLSVQLMPGLPGYESSMLSTTIDDAISVQPDYVRIYPTLVIAGTPLQTMYLQGDYTPLSLKDALIDTCLMVQRFESSGIKVIKIGLSGVDSSNIVAGPYHPSFGELTRAEMYVQKLLLVHDPNLVLHISSQDVSLLLGYEKEYLTRIKCQFNQSAIKMKVSESLRKGEFLYSVDDEYVLW